MILNDYRCNICGFLMVDEPRKPDVCSCGATDFELTFENWRTMSFANGGRPINERVNSDTGALQFHGAVDDPLTKIEMGLQDRAGDAGIRTTTPEQRRYLQQKYAKDGDSKKLREEVLMLRKANQAKAKENVKRATSAAR